MEENPEIKIEPFELVEIKDEELDIEGECVNAEIQNKNHENEPEFSENESISSPHCSKFFTEKPMKIYSKPKNKFAENEPQKCPHCSKSFSHKHMLQCHISRSHTQVNETDETSSKIEFKCTFCGKCFGDLTYLNYHIRSFHEGPKNFKCETCFSEFHHPSQLKEHIIKSDHFNVNIVNILNKPPQSYSRTTGPESSMIVKMHICVFCSKEFVEPTELKKHWLKDHQGFECEFCDTVFVEKFKYKAHLKKEHKIGLDFEQIENIRGTEEDEDMSDNRELLILRYEKKKNRNVKKYPLYFMTKERSLELFQQKIT